jgi:hypothetical protein
MLIRAQIREERTHSFNKAAAASGLEDARYMMSLITTCALQMTDLQQFHQLILTIVHDVPRLHCNLALHGAQVAMKQQHAVHGIVKTIHSNTQSRLKLLMQLCGQPGGFSTVTASSATAASTE